MEMRELQTLEGRWLKVFNSPVVRFRSAVFQSKLLGITAIMVQWLTVHGMRHWLRQRRSNGVIIRGRSRRRTMTVLMSIRMGIVSVMWWTMMEMMMLHIRIVRLINTVDTCCYSSIIPHCTITHHHYSLETIYLFVHLSHTRTYSQDDQRQTVLATLLKKHFIYSHSASIYFHLSPSPHPLNSSSFLSFHFNHLLWQSTM